MRIGAHVAGDDPLRAAKERDAEVVQIFLTPPQSWKKPPERNDADMLASSDIPIYVHAPYIINVATTNNRVRHPSRQNLENTVRGAERIGAAGVIVHGGHLPDDGDIETGFDNWRKALERLETDVPILIENTAGGDNAVARHFDRIGRLWEALDGIETPFGFCLDTCHTHAAGEEMTDAVDRITALVGHIDLVHLNDSKDEAGSGRDRHENLGHGQVDPDLLVEIVRRADTDVVVETPEDGDVDQANDIAWIRDRL